MIADMDDTGAVVLTPESNVEKIALHHWQEANRRHYPNAVTEEGKVTYRGSCLKIGPIQPKQ